jgi:hypothetical protein
MEELELYANLKDKFARKTLYASGIGLLMAAVSRLPTWEVSSPVSWIIGTVNVGFLHIFGPIIIFGLFCNMYLSFKEILELRNAIYQKNDSILNSKTRSFYDTVLLPPKGFDPNREIHRSFKIARYSLKVWVLLIPLLAYLILFFSYLDFVRPAKDDPLKWKYQSRSMQVLDLFAGIGGWGGFKPLAPSIQDNLRSKGNIPNLTSEEKESIEKLSKNIPWIYPPYQTWAYLLGFLLLSYMALSAWRNSRQKPKKVKNDEK